MNPNLFHKIYLLVSSCYYMMVVIRRKFICGCGAIPLHYCKVCGTPYLSLEYAKECERGHISHREEGATTTPGNAVPNIIHR